MEQNKGLWAPMKEQGNTVQVGGTLSITDLSETWDRMRKQDSKRRERMDKEYTPLEKVTLEEIDEAINKMGGLDNIPLGLYAKVKIGGMYQEIPLLVLRGLIENIKKEAQKLYENGKE